MDAIKKFFAGRKSCNTVERRIAPRYRLRQLTWLSTEQGQQVTVSVEDISQGGVKLRSTTPLKDDGCYVLRLNTPLKDLLFGFKPAWRKKDMGGNLYGGRFVGPGSQNSSIFRELLDQFDWQPKIRSVQLS